MEKLLPVLAVAGFVVFFGGIIALLVRHKANIRAAYRGFAEKHGLRFQAGAFPVVDGSVDGRYTLVQSIYVRKQQLAHFLVQLAVRGPVPPGMLAYGRGSFDGKGLKTGDAELDGKVHIETEDAAAVMAWLNPARRAALLELIAAKGALVGATGRVKNSPLVSYEQPGFKPKFEWIEQKYTEMLAFARRFD